MFWLGFFVAFLIYVCIVGLLALKKSRDLKKEVKKGDEHDE